MFSLILWFKTDIGMAEPGGQILIPPAGNKHMWPKYNKVPVSLSSGADVRPNFSVSQLTPGPKLIHMFKYYIDWRSSKRDQIPHPCQIITLIEDLQWRIKSPTPGKLWHGLKIFNKGSNPPPSVNCYTNWRSSKGQNIFFLKTSFQRPYSTLKSQSLFRSCSIPCQVMSCWDSHLYGNATLLALRQDVIHCIPGKRRLLAVSLHSITSDMILL